MKILSSIPVFPTFSPITLDIRDSYEEYVKQYESYSDFNFISLWTYMGHECQLSNLNENIIFRMIDYGTHEPFLSLLGENKFIHTLDMLFAFLHSVQLPPEINLIPAPVAHKHILPHTPYSFELDRDNFDYIVEVSSLLELKGNRMKPKRREINRFKAHTPKYEIREIDIKSEEDKKHITRLIEHWSSRKGEDDEHDDVDALNKLLTHEHDFHTVDLGLFIDSRLHAFTINEVIHQKTYMGHFGKADKSVPGIYTFMEHETARTMFETYGCTHINLQQDLGIENLRKAKLSYKPCKYLEKGTVTRKDNPINNYSVA